MRVIYGINPVREALKVAGAGRGIENIFVWERRDDKVILDITNDAKRKGIKVKIASKERLIELSGVEKHQGVVAVFKGEFAYCHMEDAIKAWKDSGGRALFLVLDSIQDPQNLGSLIRAAAASGVHAVIIPKDRACQVTPAVTKASAGATELVMIVRVTNLNNALSDLKEEGVWTVGIEAGSGKSLYSVDMKTDIAIVVGSESDGIRRLVKETCDIVAQIPMKGPLNSLNAAQAGVVALFEAGRQRGFS
ncbi:MAG: 23S rRNA (guanosine(2251)-2'-O)-methyltransferase RlmB [Thermodesulfobacteriota bacterium]